MYVFPTYGAFKDFAGPVATIVASAAAAYVTWSIQDRNYTLAKNKFRLDLFDKRYAVYAGTRDFLIMLMHNPDTDDSETRVKIAGFFIAMSEAEFVCGPTAHNFCKEVRKAYQRWLGAKWWSQNLEQVATNEERVQKTIDWTRSASEIINLGDRVKTAFVDDLRLTE